MQCENYFVQELENYTKELLKMKKSADMLFVLMADSHLSDNSEHTCQNIHCADEMVDYDCMVHMGDFLNGNNPEKISRKNLREAICGFKNSIKKDIYIVQGNHDGYRDETYQGQLVTDIMVDEKWYEDTCFMDQNPNLCRPENKPYYYVDFPEKRIRFVVLCSTYYEHDAEGKKFQKYYGFTKKQLEWFANTALKMPEDDWNVMIFSHIMPMTEYSAEFKIKGVLYPPTPMTELGGGTAIALLNACRESKSGEVDEIRYDFDGQKTNVLCWCVGHIHGDFQCCCEGIFFISVASQIAYIPQLWDMPEGYFPSPRDMGTVREDLWDSVAICLEERKIYFYRFGAGQNRKIQY